MVYGIIILALIVMVFALWWTLRLKKQEVETMLHQKDDLLRQKDLLLHKLTKMVNTQLPQMQPTANHILALKQKLLTTSLPDHERKRLREQLNKEVQKLLTQAAGQTTVAHRIKVRQLQKHWRDTHVHMKALRQELHHKMADYNYTVQHFPARMLARRLRCHPKAQNELEERL